MTNGDFETYRAALRDAVCAAFAEYGEDTAMVTARRVATQLAQCWSPSIRSRLA